MSPDLTYPKAIEQAVFVKNCTPILGTLVSPLTIITGRPTILDENRINQLIQITSTNQALETTSLHRMNEIRQETMKADARRAKSLGLKRNLRANSEEVFRPGDLVQVFDNENWAGTFRVLGHAGTSVVVEQGRNIKKFPRSLLRKLTTGQKERLTTGESQKRIPEAHSIVPIKPQTGDPLGGTTKINPPTATKKYNLRSNNKVQLYMQAEGRHIFFSGTTI